MHRAVLVFLFIVLPLFRVAAQQTFQGGESPDGVYSFRLANSTPEDGVPYLELFNRKTKSVICTMPTGGYASGKAVLDPMNEICLWAPDSRHFALMQRTTKRTWQLHLFSVADANCIPVKAPDFTDFALDSIHQKETFRFLRETPIRWENNDRLIIHLLGDCGKAPEVFQYEGDIVFDLKSGKITLPTPFVVTREEG